MHARRKTASASFQNGAAASQDGRMQAWPATREIRLGGAQPLRALHTLGRVRVRVRVRARVRGRGRVRVRVRVSAP